METEAAAVVWPQLGPPGTLEAGRGREGRPLEPPEGARAKAFGPRAGGSILRCFKPCLRGYFLQQRQESKLA